MMMILFWIRLYESEFTMGTSPFVLAWRFLVGVFCDNDAAIYLCIAKNALWINTLIVTIFKICSISTVFHTCALH